jgi:hypothetical protein
VLCQGKALGAPPLRHPGGSRLAEALEQGTPGTSLEETIPDRGANRTLAEKRSCSCLFLHGNTLFTRQAVCPRSGMVSYSFVTLFGLALHPDGQVPIAQAAWYRKQTAIFRDVLAVIRRHLWGHETFPTSPTDPDVVLLPRSTLERLSWAVC